MVQAPGGCRLAGATYWSMSCPSFYGWGVTVTFRFSERSEYSDIRDRWQVGDYRVVFGEVDADLLNRLHYDDSALMERVKDFPLGKGIRYYLDGWGFHFHSYFPPVGVGVDKDHGGEMRCWVMRKGGKDLLRLGDVLNVQLHELREHRPEIVNERNREARGDETPVLVFVDEFCKYGQWTVPRLTWAVVWLHSLNGGDCPVSNASQSALECPLVLLRVTTMNRELGMSPSTLWLGESPYDVVESASEVDDYVTDHGTYQRWRRLVPHKNPVAVVHDGASVSWRVDQNSIGATVSVTGDQRVEFSDVRLCSPDLLSRAGLGRIHSGKELS